MIYILPNLLTVIRIILIPLIVVLFFFNFIFRYEIIAMIFFLSSITDWLDGFLARKLNCSSHFGILLDPIADKISVISSFILLHQLYNNWWFSVAIIVIISRELIVSFLREYTAILFHQNIMYVSFIGKLKTCFQMASIFLLFLTYNHSDINIYYLNIVLLYIVVFLSLYSMINYSLLLYKKIKFINNIQ